MLLSFFVAKQKSLLFESLDIAVVSPAAPEVVALQEKVLVIVLHNNCVIFLGLRAQNTH